MAGTCISQFCFEKISVQLSPNQGINGKLLVNLLIMWKRYITMFGAFNVYFCFIHKDINVWKFYFYCICQ